MKGLTRFVVTASPHLKATATTPEIMWTVVASLMPLVAVAFYFFGISAGAGLVLKRMTIRPTISFPVGREGSGSTFGLEFAFNIGPTRR